MTVRKGWKITDLLGADLLGAYLYGARMPEGWTP